MNPFRQFLFAIVLSIIIVTGGTIGYMLIEGWNLLDSLYMTVITLATVGYGEIHQISPMGRIYTIILIFVGVGCFFYVAVAVVQFMVEGRIREVFGRRRLDIKIEKLKGHYILCGYGRIGRVLAKHLKRKPIELVIIEKNPALVPIMDKDGVLYISGEATSEENLIKAGIDKAKGLIAALATDTDNVFLVLTARQLNKQIFIMARASDQGAKSKLLAAGANQVESPYVTGAISMAHRIIRPTVTNFLDVAFAHQRNDIQMEEIPVNHNSKLTHIMLKDSGIRQDYNLIIIAIKKSDGSMLFNPSFETKIEPNDTVIAIGQLDNLRKLEKKLNP